MPSVSRHHRRAGAGLLLGALLGCSGSSSSDPQQGSACGPTRARVVRVVDGDTVELDSGQKVRYLLVDTPESTTEVECFGAEAKAFNESVVGGKEVTLSYDLECEDRYGRLLACISVDGRDVNSLLVERGYACVLQIPPNGESRVDEFDTLEQQARAADKGLWLACAGSLPC